MALDGVARCAPPARSAPLSFANRRGEKIAELLTLALVALSLLFCGGLLLYGSGRGLDLTDEIFYLVWASNPKAYALVYQPFGYLLNPLFRLAGGNLQIYRLAGFAIAGGAGAFLGLAFSKSPRDRLLLLLYGALCALTIFFPWIVTPSYNSAANVGALLSIAGILSARSPTPARRASGALAGGAGLCISAFAKPPLFALSGALIIVLAFLSNEARARRALVAAVVLGAALVPLFIAPFEVLPLVRRILASQHVLALPNTPLGLPGKIVRDWLTVPFLLSLAAVPAALALALPPSRWTRWCGYGAIAASLYYCSTIASDAIDGALPDFMGLALLTTAAGYAGVLRSGQQLALLPLVLLLGAPFAVALGTFNNQWAQVNFSMAFPFLALFTLALADEAQWRKRAALAFAIIGPAAVMLLAAFYPYGLQDSLFEQRIPIEQPIGHGLVRVDEDTATFVDSAHDRAKGALVIDLSGTGPGVALVLGGRAPILPWLNPATTSWPDIVWARLGIEQREKAWFVGPVWPPFSSSAPATWLVANQERYCGTVLGEMSFWDQDRTLQVWRPCAKGRPHMVKSAAPRS